MFALEFDWKWLLAMAIAALLGRVYQMGKELDTLKSRFNVLLSDDSTPFPSDGSPEAEAIKVAKALHKSAGEKFTWSQAKKTAKNIRALDEKKAKGNTNGDANGKRTA